ncbi:MAG: hypothetical protein ACRCZ2_10045 [Fusobacteriaceae bacterium]
MKYILHLISMTTAGFFSQQVKVDILKKFKANSIKFSRKADDILQQQVEDYEAVDSGFLQLKTFQKTVVNLTSNLIATFTFTTRGVKYLKYVLFGLGTNQRYGNRNYLQKSVENTLDFILTDKYQRSYKKGSPNKGDRKFAKRI